MKNKKVFFIIILVLIVLVILLGILFVRAERELKNNTMIHCVMENNSKENKMELYFDFKDGQVYRYSIVNTNKLTDNINIDAYKQMLSNSNNKYKGATGKFWTDNNIYVTTEIYDLDLLSEEEFKEITAMSKKELKSKTRNEIIDSMIPMGNDGSFKCN